MKATLTWIALALIALALAPAASAQSLALCDADSNRACFFKTWHEAMVDAGYAGTYASLIASTTKGTPVVKITTDRRFIRDDQGSQVAYLGKFTATHSDWLHIGSQGASACILTDQDAAESAKTGAVEVLEALGPVRDGPGWTTAQIDHSTGLIATISVGSATSCVHDLPKGWYAFRMTDDATAVEALVIRSN